MYLIGTLGFNDDDLDDTDILLDIARCLKKVIRLSGILYLYPISNSGMGGTGKGFWSCFGT